ncbi:MAG: hypothetical protein ACPHUF_06675 [Gammaproteobacteria bacterium]
MPNTDRPYALDIHDRNHLDYPLLRRRQSRGADHWAQARTGIH